jgi:penicillin-binding protein 1A
VTVLDHTVAYATFPNLGQAVTPHAILEVRTGAGDVVWRFDRDGPKPRQVLPEKVATDMIYMMNKVAEEGTGRRALIDGVRIAGKTGTTNNYRDAWFVGYSANLVAGVWVGNDDYSSTNRMTGGSLPAMIWHAAMVYGHQGIEIKTLAGLPPAPAAPPRNEVAEKGSAASPPRPAVLTRRGTDVLVRIERMMEDASRALPAPAGEVSELPTKPNAASARSETFASATSDTASGAVRGN